MAESQVILELFFLHIRDGCSLTVLLFFLMLVDVAAFSCCGTIRLLGKNMNLIQMF